MRQAIYLQLKKQLTISKIIMLYLRAFPRWICNCRHQSKVFCFNLSGKTVIPFNANAGSSGGSSFETVKQLSLVAGYCKAF